MKKFAGVFAVLTVLTFTFMCGVAFAAGFVQNWYEATVDQAPATGPVGTPSTFSRSGLYFNDADNTFRTFGGFDSYNLGAGGDIFNLSTGSDVFAFGGAPVNGVDMITFDYYGTDFLNLAPTLSRHYIKASNIPENVAPGATASLEMRSSNVYITSNGTGDVVIQLGAN